MQKKFSWLTIAAMLLVAAFMIAGGTPSAQASGAGEKFPHFAIKTMDGKPLSSAELGKGKVMIVNFWATWCPPCRKEIPHFIELQKKYGNKVQFIGVSVDRKGPEVVKEWIKKNNVNYPVGLVETDFQDPYQNLLPQEDRGGIPYTFIVDKHGNIATRLVGYRSMDFWEEEITNLLK